jgi:hypothetical protein
MHSLGSISAIASEKNIFLYLPHMVMWLLVLLRNCYLAITKIVVFFFIGTMPNYFYFHIHMGLSQNKNNTEVELEGLLS